MKCIVIVQLSKWNSLKSLLCLGGRSCSGADASCSGCSWILLLTLLVRTSVCASSSSTGRWRLFVGLVIFLIAATFSSLASSSSSFPSRLSLCERRRLCLCSLTWVLRFCQFIRIIVSFFGEDRRALDSDCSSPDVTLMQVNIRESHQSQPPPMKLCRVCLNR